MKYLTLPLAAALLASNLAVAQEQPDEQHPAAPPITPRPAMEAPKAAQARILDITHAGSQLVAVGEEGVILRSSDGKQWTQSPSPINNMLTRVRFFDDKHGWVLGYSGSIMQTDDGGATWKLRHFDPTQHAIYDILFLDAQNGIAVGGYGNVLETHDGGQSWAAAAPELADQRLHLNAIVHLSDGSLLVAGEQGLLARSTDQGATWSALQTPYIGSFFGAQARGDKGALVYGMRGNVFETDDLSKCPSIELSKWDPDAQTTADTPEKLAATGWRKIDNPSQESLFGTLQTPTSLLFFGVNGVVVRQTGDGPLERVKTPAVETLVHAVNFKGHVIAAGRQGIMDLGALQ